MRCKTWHVQALGSTLGKRPMHFAPSFTLHAGWDTDVVAEAQAAILSHRRSHTLRMAEPSLVPRRTATVLTWLPWDSFYVGNQQTSVFVVLFYYTFPNMHFQQFYFGIIHIQKLHILNVYHLMSLNVCMYLWNTAVKVIDVLSSPKVSWCIFVAVIVLVVFVVRTQHEIHPQDFFKCTILVVKYS